MIQINLLPHHLRPIKRTLLPYIACAAVLVIAVLGMGFSFIRTQAAIMSKSSELEKHKTELAELKSIVDESNALETRKEQLADKIKTIDEITKDRIIWSRVLWNVARLTPKNVWYSEVTQATKDYPTQEQVIDPQTGKPKINAQTKKIEMKVTVIKKPILRISGYVVESPDGKSDVNPLTDAMSNDSEFSSMFQLEPPSFQNTEFEKFPVKKFTLEFLITKSDGTTS